MLLSGGVRAETPSAPIWRDHRQTIAAKTDRTRSSPPCSSESKTPGTSATALGLQLAYTNSISWSSSTQPLPTQVNRASSSSAVRDGSTPEERLTGRKQNASILDSVTRELGAFKKDLGAGDRARLDTYVENVSELERRSGLRWKNSIKEPNEGCPVSACPRASTSTTG